MAQKPPEDKPREIIFHTSPDGRRELVQDWTEVDEQRDDMVKPPPPDDAA